MTIVTIPQTLEVALAAITPAIDTQVRGVEYKPVVGTPYQIVDFLFARPDNRYLERYYDQSGYMQVTLMYPKMIGAAAMRTRAQLIRSTFKSGSILSGVKISATPEVGAEDEDGDRIMVPVIVRFFKHIQE